MPLTAAYNKIYVCVCVCVCVKGEEMDVVPLAPGPGCTANVKYTVHRQFRIYVPDMIHL